MLEISDTRLLDALHDVNTIETLREKLMSDRSTQMPLEKNIPFAGGGGGDSCNIRIWRCACHILGLNLACKVYFWVRNFTQELPIFWG